MDRPQPDVVLHATVGGFLAGAVVAVWFFVVDAAARAPRVESCAPLDRRDSARAVLRARSASRVESVFHTSAISFVIVFLFRSLSCAA